MGDYVSTPIPYSFPGPVSAPVFRPAAVAIAYAATITPNADTTSIVNVGTLTGNITIAAPTGTPTDGQGMSFRFTQDGTGSRTYTWNAAFVFGTDILSTDLPATANAKFEVGFKWHAATSKWRCIALVRGF